MESRFMRWVKSQGVCAACEKPAQVIAHHCEGATFKRKVNYVTVLLGHWFVIPLCQTCDDIVTHGSRRKFRDEIGTQSSVWERVAHTFEHEVNEAIPAEVWQGITEYGR